MNNLIPFTKKYESSENLVGLLVSRGLWVDDKNKAARYLDNIGYYRLSAYMYPFLRMPKSAHRYFLDGSKFNDTMRAISNEYNKSKEEYIIHFKRTYSNPYPPSWILGELLTIGNVNAIYRNIKYNRVRKRIAKHFGLPINVFESWLTVLAVMRNACGHHTRVWNKQNAICPAIPRNPGGRWISLPTDPLRAYFDLCIIKYFLNFISPDNDMQLKLTWLFIRFPEIDITALGFPYGWEMESLWR